MNDADLGARYAPQQARERRVLAHLDDHPRARHRPDRLVQPREHRHVLVEHPPHCPPGARSEMQRQRLRQVRAPVELGQYGRVDSLPATEGALAHLTPQRARRERNAAAAVHAMHESPFPQVTRLSCAERPWVLAEHTAQERAATARIAADVQDLHLIAPTTEASMPSLRRTSAHIQMFHTAKPSAEPTAAPVRANVAAPKAVNATNRIALMPSTRAASRW